MMCSLCKDEPQQHMSPDTHSTLIPLWPVQQESSSINFLLPTTQYWAELGVWDTPPHHSMAGCSPHSTMHHQELSTHTQMFSLHERDPDILGEIKLIFCQTLNTVVLCYHCLQPDSCVFSHSHLQGLKPRHSTVQHIAQHNTLHIYRPVAFSSIICTGRLLLLLLLHQDRLPRLFHYPLRAPCLPCIPLCPGQETPTTLSSTSVCDDFVSGACTIKTLTVLKSWLGLPACQVKNVFNSKFL